MAIHNGKFFDVEVTRAFFTDLADGYNEFNRNAKIHRGTLEDFVNTDAWQGKDAENAKKLMKANKITLLNEVLDLQAEATKLSEHILDKFRIEVDNAPDARIEYDTLWQINDDYKNLYFDYMDIHNDVESIASDSQLRFSRYGNIRIPESTNCEKAFAKLCGSDDDNAGFIYECIQKLIRFDSETEALINDAALGSKAEFLLNRMRTKDSAVNVGGVSSKSDFASGFDISDVRFGRRIVSARFNGRFLRNRFKDVIYIDDEQVPLRGGKRFSKSLRGMFTKSTTKSTSKTKSKTKSTKVNASTTIKDEAIKLDYQMNLLCDDNNSNDAEAIENINEILKQFITTETINGTEYVVYNQAKIQSALQYLDEKGLAGQLLYSLNEKIKNDGTNAIGKLSWNADAEDTYLEVEKYGAGVIITITSDYNSGPLNELDGEFIGYAATQESSKNYFMNWKGDHWGYDWDAIKAWCTDGEMKCNGQEINFLANRLAKMEDKNAINFIELAEMDDSNIFTNAVYHNYIRTYSEHVRLLVFESEMIASKTQNTPEQRDKYSRAILFSQLVETISSISNDCLGEIIIEDDPSTDEKKYIGVVKNYYNNNDSIYTVYPLADPHNIDEYLDNEMLAILNPNYIESFKSGALNCVEGVLGKTGVDGMIWTIGNEINDYYSKIRLHNEMKDLYDLGNAALNYGVSGRIVEYNYAGNVSANIIVDSMDQEWIRAATIYYNDNYDPDITEEDLIESFYSGGTIGDNYALIYNQKKIKEYL